MEASSLISATDSADEDEASSSQQQQQHQQHVQLVLVDESSDAAAAAAAATAAATGVPRIVVRAAAAWSSRPSRPTRPTPGGWWVVHDCLGAVSLTLAWVVMLYAEAIVLCVLLGPAPSAMFRWLGGLGFHSLLGLALTAHLQCAFTDPGAVPLGSATPDSILRLGPMPDGRDRIVYKCRRCDCVKPDRTHHCSVCGRCIKRMDHHCPWVNNCVGLRNQKYFVLFTVYISLCSFFTIYLCLHHFAVCLSTEWEACSSGPSPAVSTLLMIVLMLLSLLFGAFTAVMAGSQLSAIVSNTTGIERIKGERRSSSLTASSPVLTRLAPVFGQPVANWRWLSPFHAPRIPDEEDNQVLTYQA